MRRNLFVLVVALIAAGCTIGICARNSDCASGQVCNAAGSCAIPPDASVDGGADDAGPTGAADAPPDASDPGGV